ncbi:MULTISPECIES: DUF4272 domain-containing protein [unclassified Treponema]|uniref:DUF4272 domain-containing protein n=1 Tax=unclassified Treponema TaxID=2638727 RepID=UPI0020A5F0AF|nr:MULTISPECIES: DUF4272 domain-containing protein [unclassified Treponema]UTC66113.1 DUF4272 domain-containing protein [Treponema sp. OMZ 789]UTC68842.1 DUF4272 domain-containing protein [Treponema sp. OMZ 790]UTC71570.1 DUF4272 domain-containing protein [Treponema sp. OMZ 791]
MCIDPELRREKSNAKIKGMGIACFEALPRLPSSKEVKLKSLDKICERAIASLLSIQLAEDICNEQDYEESKELFSILLEKYGVQNLLLEKEKRLFDGTYTEQDAVDVGWTYEAYWALLWALGLVEDISYPNDICDVQKAITTVGDRETKKEFKALCKLRDIEEILDMLDLHYRYHWATEEKRLNPKTEIKDLNPEVLMERRRGLEWLISDEEDWYEISMDT